MHAPETVICDIYGPRGLYRLWRLRQARRRDLPTGQMQYPDPLATLWHVDPEADGSDDSCGYSYPKLTQDEQGRVRKEADYQHEFTFGKYPALMSASVYEIIHAIWSTLAFRLDRRRALTAAELDYISSLASNPVDNLRHVVEEAKHDRREYDRLWQLVARSYRRQQRRWYGHPRWHVRHWRLQIRALQKVKRFLFSRCESCGKGFPWGYAPVSRQWHGTGPLWFKSERLTFHHECARSTEQVRAA